MEWYVTLGIIAGSLASVGVIWKIAVYPILHAIWLAIKAAPQIPLILDDLKEILQSDIVSKLDSVVLEQERVRVQLDATLPPLEKIRADVSQHELRLSDHELRINKLEKEDEA